MRTDRHRICTDCAVRYAAVSVRCPRCGRRRGYDTRRRRDRRRALERLLEDATTALKTKTRAGATPGRDRFSDAVLFYFRRVLLPASGIAGAALAAWARTWDLLFIGIIGAFVVQLALVLVLALLGSALWLVAHLARTLTGHDGGTEESERPEPPRIRVEVEDDAPPSPGVTRVRGRVRVVEPIASPLRHTPCAAFRVVGESAVGAVDDAGAARFVVITDDGEEVLIDDVAAVEVEVPGTPATVRTDAALERFLEERALFPERGPVQLAEATLVTGDEVEVEGTIRDTRTAAVGYRETRAHRTLGEVRVRRVPKG